MTTKYLCDHRNCTVEMVIGPMKNPVNHKQQGMLGTVQIQDVFCRKSIKPRCKISTLNNLYYDHAQNYSKDMYTYRCTSKLCSRFFLETNKMNIKRNVTCEDPCRSTLQRFPIIRALKRFFLLVETWVLCTLINCFHCYPLALLEKLFYSMSKKLQEHFWMTKEFPILLGWRII